MNYWEINVRFKVFATHWVPPTEVPIVTEQNRKCIERKLVRIT